MLEKGAGSNGKSSVFVFDASLQMTNMRKSRGRGIRISVERARCTMKHEGRAKSTGL